MDTEMLLIGLVIVALIAVVAWMYARKRRSQSLQQRFGPEYRRAVDEMGSRDKAEAELLARQKRVSQLKIVPLSPADAQRYTQEWRALQARFVDNPQGTLVQADRLVGDLMQKRGYPMADFERSAADISVHHPGVVEHYRAAHALAERERSGQLDTESMRQAVIHYRALFSELLEVQPQDDAASHDHHRHMRTQP